ncbi:hypothetical protein C8F01DRAFT_1144892 [Mycena amicta]|nr:hypothetical protein C8F01DRAFT_1144892 [Mycena amicta]
MVAEDPQLPLELEREIFETTARLHPDMRYPLLFVARRVLIWIEPTLYRTLVFPDHRLSTLLAVKPPEFFAKTTRHVSIGFPATEDAVGILKLCPAVTHLAIGSVGTDNDDKALPAAFLELQQLRCLSFHPNDVLLAPAESATLPVFSSLTHLELLRNDNSVDDMESFCVALPALTHLALNEDYEDPRWPLAERLLQRCQQLLLLVLLSGDEDEADELADRVPEHLADARVVVTWYKDWDEGVLDCYTYWDVAGDFAARKRQGLIKESCFFAERD